MADSLVDLVSNYFDPNVTTKLASTLGVDLDHVQAIVDAAVPATLASLAGAAMTGDGAKKISDAIGSADSGMLDKLPDLVTNKDLSTGGLGLLNNLLGPGKVEAITAAVAKSTGAPTAATQSILGILGPATLGAMSQLDPDSWSSGAGIAKTLAAQKDVIAAAMPAGLGQLLGGLGGVGAAMGGVMGMAQHAAGSAMGAAQSAAGNMAGAAGNMANQTASQASMPSSGQSGGIPSWVWIVAAVVVAGGLYWYLYMRH